MDRSIEEDFLKRPARALPSAYIQDWYFAATTDWTGHDHVAWFLPRVMEMLAAGEVVATVGDEVVLQRLALTGFPDHWPPEEVEAVKAFCMALFHRQITARDNGIDRWLCMFGQGGLGIDPFLGLLDDMDDADLAELLYANWFQAGRGRVQFTAFWSVEPAKSKVWAWYTSGELAERMDRIALAGDLKAAAIRDLILDQ
jgi:hypothetical protein